MLNLRNHFKEFRDADALHTLVAIDAVIDEHVFVTKAGDLAAFVSVQGIDPECREPADLNSSARRFERALRLFDSRFRIYQYLIKRAQSPLSADRHANPIVASAERNHLHFLNERAGRHYRTEIAFAVVYEGWRDRLDARPMGLPLAGFRRRFSTQETTAALDEELDHARELLLEKVSAFATQLRDSFDIKVLDISAAFRVVRLLLNDSPEKAEHGRLNSAHFVDFQACGSPLECHRDFLRLGNEYLAVLTLKEPPPQTYALMLASLQDLPCDFVLAGEWKRKDNATVRRLIRSKRRHFHNVKASLGSQLTAGTSGAPADVLIDNAAVAFTRSLGECLEEIDVKGRAFGEYSLTVTLSEKDPNALRRAVAQCLKAFAAHGAQLNEETYNRLSAWLATQAGNSVFNLRRLWLSDANAADLSLLFAPATGEIRNNYLNREAVTLFEARDGTLYSFNLHVQDVAHTFVCGGTGSGKSFLLNFLLTHLQKYDPLIRIFDLGHSYESLTRQFGGSYLPIHADHRPFTINPFCLEPTKENLRFLHAFVKVLAETGGTSLTAEDDQDLYEQIENLYYISPDKRRLSTLVHLLRENIRRQLRRWCEGGPYGSLFDNATDTLTMTMFQTFDFEGAGEDKKALEPLLFYVLHRTDAMFTQDPGRFKIFVMDEAWLFLSNPVIRAYMREAFKTWRKKNACLILATQSLDDLTSSAMLPVVLESCPTQIFLANPRMNHAVYREAFHLNEREIECVAGLVPKNEFLVKLPDHSKVLQLNVGRKEYWIYTNNAQDTVRKREAFDRFGFEEGLEQLAKGNA